ncbi:MAG: dephospho-CoA kinase [Chloroflexota bacterium]|nr:dephospho-CoA kinase [Chloroflexota bacterium]
MIDPDAPETTSGHPFVVGVTGNIACGKSTVVAMLAELGAVAIDADTVYHELIVPEAPLWRALVSRYGDTIVGEDGAISRHQLGSIVFSDPNVLAELDRLTHPAVVAEIRRRLDGIGTGVVAIDAVKLLESGIDAYCDLVWLVVCDPDQQIQRLMARNGLSQADAERRIRAQPAIAPKLHRADVVIDTSGTLASTRCQVEDAWRHHIQASAR